MFGFPWEKSDEIKSTTTFMKKISNKVNWINPGGILVPLPGTEIYDKYKDEHDFSEWWLKKEYTVREEINPPMFKRIFFNDDDLYKNFFNYRNKEKKEIRKAISLIGKQRLRNVVLKKYRKSFPMFRILYFLLNIVIIASRFLYNLNPKIETYFADLFKSLIKIFFKKTVSF